ncbi:MAG: 3-hydroxyacyl-ACP dehydratase FabZ family protein [Giesbergeria sp.]
MENWPHLRWQHCVPLTLPRESEMPVVPLPYSADHPVFAGHFPGQPIVPGVLLLDWAQAAIEAQLGHSVQALTEAKFHSPATPFDALELDFEVGTCAVRFEIRSAVRKIASGRFPLPLSAPA